MILTGKLPVLPLSVEQKFFTQKCLLPGSIFPASARPGTFAKVTTNSQTVAVCQLFQRKDAQQVFLDECVTVGNMSKYELDLQDHVFESIECLEVSETPAKEISITFLVSDRLLRRKNLHNLNLTFLMDVAQILLQSFHLVQECTVRIPELIGLGILSLQVRVNCALPNTVYCIDEYTCLIIDDVQLVRTVQNGKALDSKIFRDGFEASRQELQDILYLAQMQTKCESSCRLLSLNALLVGATGIGKSMLAERFITENNCNCFRVVASDVLGQYPGETETELRRIFKAAHTFRQQLKPRAPTVILLEDLHLLCPAQQSSMSNSGDASNALRTCTQLLSLVDELHRKDSGIICLATTTSPQALSELARRPGRFEREIIITPPTPVQRKQLFAVLCSDSYMGKETENCLTNEILELIEKHTHGYVLADLALLARSMDQVLVHNKNSSAAVITDLLKETIKKSHPTSVRSSDIQVLRASEDFSTIGGMSNLKRILKISVLAALEKREAFQRFGISAPKGVLLYGPPGCAKTTVAKCLAAEANYNFICVSTAEVYSPYVGCAEKFIAKIFDTARRNAPCIIFLDEIDSLVGKRTTCASDVQIRILSTLLTEMDGIISAATSQASVQNYILVVAATNRPDMIDDALLRPGRFDKLIHVPAPDYESRLNILQLHQNRMPFAADVNLCQIAERTVNYSGADLCNICNEAAIYAFQCDFNATDISAKDFDHVLSAQKSSLTQQQIEWFLDFEKNFSK